MNKFNDLSQLLQRLLVPELREFNERLKSLETRMDENESRAERRHQELLAAIRQSKPVIPMPDRFRRSVNVGMPLE